MALFRATSGPAYFDHLSVLPEDYMPPDPESDDEELMDLSDEEAASVNAADEDAPMDMVQDNEAPMDTDLEQTSDALASREWTSADDMLNEA